MNGGRNGKGVFIVLDGNDGSGKATQARMLSERLAHEGKEAMKVDFPAYDRNFFGAFVGECLAGQHGDFLHMDPKIASSLYALDRMEHEVLGIPRPDLIIYLRVPVEKSLVLLSEKRKAKNQILGDGEKDMVEEDRAYLENSRMTADWLLAHQPNWRLVECMEGETLRTPDAIHEDIWREVSKALPSA